MHKFALVLGLLFVGQAAQARPIPTPAEIANFETIARERQMAQKDDLAFDYSGVAALPGCSGSLVTFGQADSEKGVILTNGHCVGLMDGDPHAVTVDQSYNARVTLYIDQQHTVVATAKRLIYGIMMPNDVAFLELDTTYKALATKGVKARKIAPQIAAVGTDIALASGYFNTVVSCKVEKLIHEIHEDIWINVDSYKYHCKAGHGTSGSPLVNLATNEVVGVNYTGNDDGEQCTYNNPCEVDAQGNITVDQGANYGDQVYKIMSCLDGDKKLDLTVEGCLLPKP